ncbi:uncharacterized protein [Miscanthus floridulus]|uniref:uncharacterized protein n=1 Tax=Miscanthus floridulus TaxID=154761 RepID=UPI00345B2263
MPPPLPPPLQRWVAVPKRLHPRSSWKRKAEVPALAPLKSLKVSTGSAAQQVVEAQAAVQHGEASARADPRELVAQGEVTWVATEQAREEMPMPRVAEAHESDGVEAPSVAKATEGGTEAPQTSEAEATKAMAPRTAEADMAGIGAPETTEAGVAGTGAPKTTEAGEVGAGMSVAKPAAQEVEAEVGQASIPSPVQGPPPLHESAQEVEVHAISSDDTSWVKEVVDAEAADTVEQPVLTSELEKEASRAAEASRVEVQGWKEKAEASRVNAQCWKEKAKASQVEAQRWEEKAEELEKEVTRTAEASIAVQAVLKAEIREHDALKSAAYTVCEAQEVEGAQSGSSLKSRLVVLSGQVCERLRGALHAGIKRALAVISSHYTGVDLKAVSDGYVLLEDDEEADKEVAKLMELAKGPSMTLAKLFEEEVVPPPPSAGAGDSEP